MQAGSANLMAGSYGEIINELETLWLAENSGANHISFDTQEENSSFEEARERHVNSFQNSSQD